MNRFIKTMQKFVHDMRWVYVGLGWAFVVLSAARCALGLSLEDNWQFAHAGIDAGFAWVHFKWAEWGQRYEP